MYQRTSNSCGGAGEWWDVDGVALEGVEDGADGVRLLALSLADGSSAYAVPVACGGRGDGVTPAAGAMPGWKHQDTNKT